MSTDQIRLATMVLGLTLLSGFFDSVGFVHASRIWRSDKIDLRELGLSAAGFAVGISIYWLVLRYLQHLATVSTEIQTLGWFSVTIVGVALMSGQIWKWERIDQSVAILVVAGTAWLLYRVR